MKALSIKQPWAWLIVNGHKDIENRTWKTKFRGEILIHAGQNIAFSAYEILSPLLDVPHGWELQTGGIIGKCIIVDCVEQSDSEWFTGPFGFRIENAEPLPFFPCRGRLGFFDVEIPAKN